MAKYIDKAVVLDRFCKVVALYEKVDDCSAEIMKQAQRIVREVPAADVAEVRHGHWVDRPTVKGQVYCCECATIEKATDSNYKSQYCPNCGTKMDWI